MHFRSALRKLVKSLLSLPCLFAGNLSLPLISITKGIIPPAFLRGILDRNNFRLARDSGTYPFGLLSAGADNQLDMIFNVLRTRQGKMDGAVYRIRCNTSR